MSNVFSFDDDDDDKKPPLFQDDNTETEYATDEEPEEEQEEGESGNRTFIILGIIIGIFFLCTLIAGGVYALVVLPGQQAARQEAQATVEAVNTQAAIAVAQTQEVLNYTPTLPPTETPTLTPTVTPLLAGQAQATETPGVGIVARDESADATATAAADQAAMATQASSLQLTATAMPTPLASPTALSDTGFADNVGVPGLMIGTIILVAVIFLARRLREAPSKR